MNTPSDEQRELINIGTNILHLETNMLALSLDQKRKLIDNITDLSDLRDDYEKFAAPRNQPDNKKK